MRLVAPLGGGADILDDACIYVLSLTQLGDARDKKQHCMDTEGFTSPNSPS